MLENGFETRFHKNWSKNTYQLNEAKWLVSKELEKAEDRVNELKSALYVLEKEFDKSLSDDKLELEKKRNQNMLAEALGIAAALEVEKVDRILSKEE